ncbi:MAG: hypothetical protein CW691_04040 [Candidatus Bathyarchaeum sp.]|nr:MAG: hypothetical protein CW691_04040 [Candidatus Bathyarchaeum sp.]
MDKKIVTAAIVVIAAVAIIALVVPNLLQNATNDNNKVQNLGLKETISADSSGGQFSVFNDSVEMNIYAGSVPEQVDITIETITNPVEDSTLCMLSCFEFGPNGLTFDNPIELIIHYNVDDLPQGVNESDIKVYVLTNGVWEPIEDSFANQAMNYAVASVSHFSKMGCAAYTPSTEDVNEPADDDSDSEDDDGSAQYWFKADLNYYTIKSPRLLDSDDNDMYYVGVCAHWKPVSYVQYYEMKWVFNGNLPEDYGWSGDYREQGKSYVNPSYYPINEGYIYHLGGDPEIKGFLSVIKTGEWTASKLNEDTGEMESMVYGNGWPLGNHGYNFFSVHTTVEDHEELSAIQVGSIVSEMETFVQQYVNGWEVWVRGVTETKN